MPSCTAGDWTIAAACRPPTPLNVLVKLIAIFMFVIAYKLGRKITDIKV